MKLGDWLSGKPVQVGKTKGQDFFLPSDDSIGGAEGIEPPTYTKRLGVLLEGEGYFLMKKLRG